MPFEADSLDSELKILNWVCTYFVVMNKKLEPDGRNAKSANVI